MKVFGYTRISVDLQEDFHENTSIENQKKIIRDYVYEIFPDCALQIYEDRDRSGYTFSQRESYQKMRKELINGDSNILVVKDFSRFSRRNSLGLLELETLRDAGVRIISIGDNIDYPTRDDWMLIQFKFLMNEMPVTDTSKKIKQMIDSRQKSGRWICAVPYGYRITNTKEMTYEIDPPAAEIVREIFRLYNIGWGYKKIANHLTDKGIPTPRANEISYKESLGKSTKLAYNESWSIATIQGILKNDFYIGILRQKKYSRKGINGSNVKLEEKDNIIIENAHIPIIDRKTFSYTIDQMEHRSKNNYRGEKKYATDYSGFLFCGDCGSPMFSMSRPDLAPAYTCGTYHRRGLKGCSSHHIRVDTLDELLKNFIVRIRGNCSGMISCLQEMIDDQPMREKQLGSTIDEINLQLNDAKVKLKAIYKEKILIDAGLSDTKSLTKLKLYDEMEEELLSRIDALENQFNNINDIRNSMIETNSRAKTVLDVFDDILNKDRLDKRDIGLIVDKIVVYQGWIDIKLKSDVDELLSIENCKEVNFNCGSNDISKISQKSDGHTDKVFTVNVINEGDPLEIYTAADGEVIFKKYSPVGELSPLTAQYAEVLHRSTNQPVLIFDRDKVIACAGISKKEVLDRRLSQELEDYMERRESYLFKDGAAPLIPAPGVERNAAIATPILAAGDVAGAVVLLNDENAAQPSASDVKLVQVAANFLGRQMEE